MVVKLAADPEERASHMVLGARLGYERTHKFREWIECNRAELETRGAITHVGNRPATGGRLGTVYYLNRSGHDDFVSLLITLALADEEGKLSGSPMLDRGTVARDIGGIGRFHASPIRDGGGHPIARVQVTGDQSRVVVSGRVVPKRSSAFGGGMGGF